MAKYIRLFMLRVPLTALILFAAALAAGCASAQLPAAPPAIPFETKMSWILRLEDQRVLRDPPPPEIAPAPVKGKRTLLPPPPPNPDLTTLLTDGEARIRRRAALSVGRVGLPEGAAPLIPLLQSDPDPEVRQMAAFALGLLGATAAVEPLRAALADPLPIIAGRAADALGLIGDASSAQAIGEMVVRFLPAAAGVSADDGGHPLAPEAEAFRLGVYALARLKAYDALAAAVIQSDGQPRVRWWPVAYALERTEDKRAVPSLISFTNTQSDYARAFAAKGLGELKDPAAVPALLTLVNPSRPGHGPSIQAIKALGLIGDPRASAPLTKVLYTRGLSPMIRAETLTSLSQLSDGVSLDAFIDFLADPSPVVRAAALKGAARWDRDSFMTVLSGLDTDSHWSVRSTLATILADTDPERALPRLNAMLADQDTRVIPAVLNSIAKLKAPDAEKILLERLRNEDPFIRASAAANLGELKPQGGAIVEALTAAYKRAEADLAYDARAAVLEALTKYGVEVSLPLLKTALTDKDWAIRLKAAELLKTVEPSVETAHAIRPAPTQRTNYEAPTLANPPVSPQVFIETEKGTIQLELDVLDAPETCQTFMALARQGYFDGLSFHRVVPDFVVQAGDPRGDGEGGPGYTIRDELNQEPYLRGTLGMALAWRDTGGSQFFITQSPQPHLDARYTVFGRVISGIEVIDVLTQGDVMKRVRVWDGSTN